MPALTSLLLSGALVPCAVSIASAAPETVLEAATREVCLTLTDRFDTVELSLMAPRALDEAEARRTPGSESSIRLSPLRRGRLTAAVTGATPGKPPQEFRFRVHGYAAAWVARADLRREAFVHPQDFEQANIDIAALERNRDELAEPAERRVLVRALRRGAPLTTDHLREAPMIARQQRVRVSVRHKNIQVFVEGIARSTGWQVGDGVKVQIVGATALVEAVVTGEGEAHVEA